MPEKRKDMELEWQRDFDHQCHRLQDQWARKIESYKGSAELELQQSIRTLKEQSEREQSIYEIVVSLILIRMFLYYFSFHM